MNKTRSCELIWRLITVCGLGHHLQHLPTPSGRGLAQTVTTGQESMYQRDPRTAKAGTESHPIGVGLNINPATDVRGYSHWEAGTSPHLLEIFTINPKQLLLEMNRGTPGGQGSPRIHSIQQVYEGWSLFLNVWWVLVVTRTLFGPSKYH